MNHGHALLGSSVENRSSAMSSVPQRWLSEKNGAIAAALSARPERNLRRSLT